MERGHGHHLRWAQLSSLPLAILTSDYMLVLPKLKGKREKRATDLHDLANRAWFQVGFDFKERYGIRRRLPYSRDLKIAKRYFIGVCVYFVSDVTIYRRNLW